MIRFGKKEARWDFAEVTRTCRSCGKKYTYYAYRGGSVYPSCMECARCQNRLWYYPEEDLVLDKYFGDQGKRDLKRMDETLESLASPCACGGNYRHIDVGEAGVPKNCPLCGTPVAKDELFMYDRGIETISPERKNLPVAVLEFYDDSLPDLSKATAEDLLGVLQNPDRLHRDHGIKAIRQIQKPFPLLDDLAQFARKSQYRDVRQSCAEILAAQGDAPFIPQLIELSGDKDHLVRANVQFSLLLITSQLEPTENSGSVGLRAPDRKVPATVEEWKRWWQEHKDAVKIRDYPPHIKEKLGLV